MKRKHRPVDRAVAYVRASTTEQHLGPQAQRDAIETWATSKKVKVVDWHYDLGVSGATPLDKRPGLFAAFHALKVKSAGLLVVAKRDRLARSVLVAATVERLAERAGVRIVSADGTTNQEGPEGELLRGIIDAFAAYERAMISARTFNALAVKKRRGERVGSIPFGYTVDAEGKLVELAHEQRALERLRELVAEGFSVRAIATKLEAERHRPRGKRWHPTTVARLMARL